MIMFNCDTIIVISMNKILATTVILGVAAMMVGALIPAMADPAMEADGHKKGHGDTTIWKPHHTDTVDCPKLCPVEKHVTGQADPCKSTSGHGKIWYLDSNNDNQHDHTLKIVEPTVCSDKNPNAGLGVKK